MQDVSLSELSAIKDAPPRGVFAKKQEDKAAAKVQELTQILALLCPGIVVSWNPCATSLLQHSLLTGYCITGTQGSQN